MDKPLSVLGGAAIAACILLGTTASAQGISATDFSANKTRIKTEYATDKRACGSLASNAKDICMAAAKAKYGKL